MTAPAAPRSIALDAARGLAVLAMFVFHFVWDLGHFGHIDADIPFSPGFKAFGHTIALSFLFVAGVSLALAHGARPDWRKFWRRFAIVAAAALLVTAATYAVFPEAFVFFGILHCIAGASLLALPFLFLPWPAAFAASGAVALMPFVATNAFFDAPWWWWTGLSTFEPPTNDYRPLLPWAAATLAGVGAAKAFRARLSRRGESSASHLALAPLAFLGRRSLTLYLVHQPAFFAGFAALAFLMATPSAPDDARFEEECRTQCVSSGGKDELCRAACACTAREISRQNALAGAIDDAERRKRIDAIARDCAASGK